MIVSPQKSVKNPYNLYLPNIPILCKLVYKFDGLCVWLHKHLFAISSYNSQQIFVKFSFPELACNSEGLDFKKSGIRGEIRDLWTEKLL